MEQHGLAPADLAEALSLQQELGRPLGEVLTAMGAVSDGNVAQALAQLHDLSSAQSSALDTPAPAPELALTRLPEAEAERLGVVPISSGPGGAIRLAAAAPLTVEALAGLEAHYRAPVEIVLAPADEIRQGRRRAYRCLLAGDLPPAASAERAGLDPEDVDLEAMSTLGAGFCLLYGLLPLRHLVPSDPAARDSRPARPIRRIAAAFLVHPSVVSRIAARLRAPVVIVPVAPLEVDAVLAVLAVMPTQDMQAQHPTAGAERGPAVRAHTLEVLDALEEDRAIEPVAAAHTRARALGLPTSLPDPGPLDWPLLPPELRGPYPIYVRGLDDRALVLATARPNPRLSRAVAALYPGWAIAWEVALPDIPVVAQPEKDEKRWTVDTQTN